ncbi:MAG: chemotaxis protein CheD [Oscillospiraceae bacterium]
MKICKAPDTIITYALGSCVGIVLYDQQIKTSALIHIMLPDAMSNPPDNVYKYANTAIEETLKKLDIMGVSRVRLIAKIAGGAKMFNVTGNSMLGTIGERNIERVVEVLQRNHIPIRGNDTGGITARTMVFDPDTGVVTLRIAGKGQKTL